MAEKNVTIFLIFLRYLRSQITGTNNLVFFFENGSKWFDLQKNMYPEDNY